MSCTLSQLNWETYQPIVLSHSWDLYCFNGFGAAADGILIEKEDISLIHRITRKGEIFSSKCPVGVSWGHHKIKPEKRLCAIMVEVYNLQTYQTLQHLKKMWFEHLLQFLCLCDHWMGRYVFLSIHLGRDLVLLAQNNCSGLCQDGCWVAGFCLKGLWSDASYRRVSRVWHEPVHIYNLALLISAHANAGHWILAASCKSNSLLHSCLL